MSTIRASFYLMRRGRATASSAKGCFGNGGPVTERYVAVDFRRRIAFNRSSHGNVLTIFICIFAALISGTLVAARFATLQIASHREMTAVESAALIAAKDLSLIVIEDPNYGFISLCDYAPIGKATTAIDQQPVSVTSINQVVANARMQMLVALQLNNHELLRLAHQDAENAQEATKRLNEALCRSLRNSGSPSYDLNGNRVEPLRDVRKALSSNLHGVGAFCKPRISGLNVTLGWIDDDTPSGIGVPLPIDMANVPPALRHRDQYNAFVDVPCGGEHYYFTVVDKQEQLLDVSKFVPFDGKRPCSVVRVTATLDQVGQVGPGTEESSPRLSLFSLRGTGRIACG